MMLEMMDRRKMMMVLIILHTCEPCFSHNACLLPLSYFIFKTIQKKKNNFRDEQTEVITVRSDKEEVAELDSIFFLLAPRVPLFPRYHDFLQVAT